MVLSRYASILAYTMVTLCSFLRVYHSFSFLFLASKSLLEVSRTGDTKKHTCEGGGYYT